MSYLQASFADSFGEANTERVIPVARGHNPGVTEEEKGGDEFRWAFLRCISQECFTRFAEEHEFDADPIELKDWSSDNASYIRLHQGDFDIIAAFAGEFERWGLKSTTTDERYEDNEQGKIQDIQTGVDEE